MRNLVPGQKPERGEERFHQPLLHHGWDMTLRVHPRVNIIKSGLLFNTKTHFLFEQNINEEIELRTISTFLIITYSKPFPCP